MLSVVVPPSGRFLVEVRNAGYCWSANRRSSVGDGAFPRSQSAEMDRLTREGLADVDAGRTIPHEVVVRWVNEVLLAWGGLA